MGNKIWKGQMHQMGLNGQMGQKGQIDQIFKATVCVEGDLLLLG